MSVSSALDLIKVSSRRSRQWMVSITLCSPAIVLIPLLTAYEKRFGTYNPSTQERSFTAEHLSFLNSFGLPAKCLGAVTGLLVAERFGRKPSYIAMQFIVIIGIAVSYSAQNFGQALGGRIIVQCFVGWDNFLAPMFLAEISPTALRGGIVVVYVLAHILGSLICSFVTLKTSSFEGDSSWRIPLASMFAFPLFVLVFFWFVPESPRWLVRKGQNERAIKHLCWLKGSSVSEQDVVTEVGNLHESICSDLETKGRWADFLKGPNRVRHDANKPPLEKHKSLLIFPCFIETTRNCNRSGNVQPIDWPKLHESVRSHLHQGSQNNGSIHFQSHIFCCDMSGSYHNLFLR